MTRKIDVSLAHRRNFLCSGNKYQVAQLKSADNDIANQARNDMIEYKLVSNQNYLDLLNRSAESIHLSVFSVDDNPESRKIGIGEK